MASAAAPVVDAVRLGSRPSAPPDFPGLGRIAPRIARGLTSAFASSGGATRVTGGEIRTQALADWKSGQGTGAAVARFRDRKLKGGMLLAVPARLVTSLVDRFYGGDGAVPMAQPVFGLAEQRLFDRLAEAAAEALAAAWSDVEPLAPKLSGSAFGAADIAFGKADDVVIVQRFTSEDPVVGAGAVEIVYPLSALRGIPALLSAGEDGAEDFDPHWQTRLHDAVMQTRLPVRTVLARPTVALGRLLSLAPGDVIPVTLPARVPLTVAGRLFAHGTIGEANGHAAIKIDKFEQGVLSDD